MPQGRLLRDTSIPAEDESTRAEVLLNKAEELAKKSTRSEEQEQSLEALLNDARTEFELAQALDYGETQAFDGLFSELERIEEELAEGGSSEGLLDRINQRLSILLEP